ncbi:MAG: FecR protein [Syntrophaceae bacterium PtaU1.Bin231]|nr:MAG: FecR protein [Syntrophaceae bacterium PtaU1.Bin231]
MRPVFGKTPLMPFLLAAFILALSAAAALAAPAAVRGPAVPANQLPDELKRTDIKTFYAPAGTKQAGAIQTVVGRVVVARPDLNRAYYAAPGDILFEKDVVFTLAGSKCRFKLIGEDVVMMGDNSRLGIKNFEQNPQQSTKSSIFTVLKGKAMFYALKLLKFRRTFMQVETPTAVCGVRGTKWGVEVTELPGAKRASLPIQVADSSDLGFRLLAQAPPALPQFQTTILCFSGTVFAGSTAPPPPGAPPPPFITLSQGQMTTVGPGTPPAPPAITPPSLANAFLEGTFAPPPDNSGTPPPPPPPPPGETQGPDSQTQGGATPTGTVSPDTTSIAQQQNTQSRPTTHEGFAVGMLTSDGGFIGTYISESIQNFDAGQAKAVYASTYPARMSTTTLEELEVTQGTASNLPQALQKTEIGYNAYMEWGSWTQPVSMTATGGPYVFNNKGYYVWGDRTATLPATISGTYRGDAYGTIWSAGGGTDLGKGTVSMDISYAGGAGTISNFNLLIGNTGVQNGSATFNSTGNYAVTGTSLVEGQTGGAAYAYGNFYGPAANYTGGVWKASAAGKYANGNYIATKP